MCGTRDPSRVRDVSSARDPRFRRVLHGKVYKPTLRPPDSSHRHPTRENAQLASIDFYKPQVG